MWSMKNSPAWDVADEGGGDAPVVTPPADTTTTMYPDDQPVADAAVVGDVEKPTDGTPAAETAPVEDAAPAGEWAEYVDDAAKTPEENAAAKLENDLKHPVNQIPEDGVYNLTMPEGVEVDAELLAGLGSTLKDLNMSHGNAQALADKFIEIQTAKATEQTKRWGETVNGWLDTAKKDPDMGGAKWDGTVRDASSVVSRFGTPELKEYLEASGAGNHPEVIRLMAKVGSMIAEDNPAISENPGGNKSADPSRRMYPEDNPKGN